ncbi:hypothetical protein OQJ19_12775 [Fluoribacter gormanii]|uniref:hypothetical protein n=1 Tax=Fluoribacter gormanii TaxID=464 RepID=UPI002244D0E7|nr:hypothetical protein [Fluoribacter gormanii]MCW8443023.1 hypothetical protein [Fluoribacter gormanii]MCW8471514.1 hypothetical protein [Fluoribacter gormanii]
MQGKQELSIDDYIEIGNNLFSDDSEKKKLAWEQVNEARKQAPGFFTPYKKFGDFGSSLAAPIVTPLVLGLLAGLSTIAAAVGAITTAGSLLVASGAAPIGLFNKNAKETAKNALSVAGVSAIVAVACAAITVALAVITAVLTPLLVAQIFTRTGATVISAVSEGFSSCCGKTEEDESLKHARLVP